MPNLKSLQDTFKFMSDRQEIEGTLYRGISIESNKELKSIAKFYQDNVGNSIDMGRSSQGYFHDYPAFSSTTKRMVADDYSMGFEDAYSIRFVIKGNGGVLKGFDMREFGLPDSEVILPFSKKYRVDKITKYVNDLDKKSYEITLTQM